MQLPVSEPPWKKRLNEIASKRNALSDRLAAVHARLQTRVKAEKPELLARLDKDAPKPAETGYGLLPQIIPDEPEITDDSPVEQSYSIRELGAWVAQEHGLVTELDSRLERRLSPLEQEVEFYRKREENFRNLDAHVLYHSFWQQQIPTWPSFWERKNRLLALYRTWRASLKSDDRIPSSDVHEKLEQEMLKIKASPSLCLERAPSGRWSLPVRIATDVRDEAFLAAFAEGVELFWNGSQAMKDARLRIDVTWDRRSPESLYPEGAPRKGEQVDTARHRERFGPAPLVLTTGADSTHVLKGAVFLGTGRISRRTLAHEFSHLLGFDDAYIRAYHGSVDTGNGAVFVEVTPFPGSLLATPGRGRVTRGMAETLIDAYRNNGCGKRGTESEEAAKRR